MQFKFLLLLILFPFAISAQNGWNLLPSTTPETRWDDLYFLNADTGWAILPYNDYYDSPGKIIRTNDGGQSWIAQLDSSGVVSRCIQFFDGTHGVVGVLETGRNPGDTSLMYQTSDAGQTWAAVAGLPGPRPGGICGLYAVNDSVMYGVGRYYGPAGVYKTTDQGNSWTYSNLDSLAGGLVDVYFWDEMTGIAIGSAGIPYADSAGAIIRTTDGGASWSRVYTTVESERILWKISFPSPQIGYVSMQRLSIAGTPSYFLKSTDGGLTWQEYPYFSSYYACQGIGFVNDSVGWIGGGGLETGFITTDGGQSWNSQVFEERLNRFRFVSDSIGYASGRQIWKFTGLPVVGLAGGWPETYILSPVFPDPVRDIAHVELTLPHEEVVGARILSLEGKLIWERAASPLPAGTHRLDAPMPDAARGMYLLEVKAGPYLQTRRFLR